jgi:hypothetical protein
MSRWNQLLGAALDAAERGWHVFPLVRAGKTPVVRNWEQRATTEKRQIYRGGPTSPGGTLGWRLAGLGWS